MKIYALSLTERQAAPSISSAAQLCELLGNVRSLHEISVELIATDVFQQLAAAPIAQAAPQPCACRTPEAAATRQKDEAEAVKLQRILFDRHMDCRPADTGLMGWAAAVLSAPQPEQSGLAGHVCGGDAGHNTVNIQLVDRAPWGDLRIGAPVTLAALSAQGGEQ